MDAMFTISDGEFKQLRDLIYDRFGINLTENKKTLLIGRLQSILKKYQLQTFAEYFEYITNSKDGSALNELVNKVSTNFSYFYREEEHFKFLQSHFLPEWCAKLKEKNVNDLRLWCAGCSTGEEPYTIIMVLMDYFKGDYSRWDAGILATDISETVLGFANKAVYPEDRINRLPPLMKTSYFERTSEGEYHVQDKIRKQVTFRRFNLMNKEFPFKKKFHAIFCRNVMIYFDQATKEELVSRYTDCLEPGGYLFIGHSESIGRTNDRLEYVMPATYRKR